MTGRLGDWEPAPAPADETVGAFARQVAQAAGDRAEAWAAVGQVLTMDEAAITALRDGGPSAAWRAGARWLGDDAGMFWADLITLDAFARGAGRRQPAADAASLGRDHAAIVAPALDVVAYVREVADLCRQEAAAWGAGDMAKGKALRVREREVIDAELVPVLPELGSRLAREAQVKVWQTLGRLVLAWLSVESGKDYQRAVLGDNGR
ncbi:hypothetical protein FE374_13615 [Georgenia yuyongxinii]|uniref:Uncharacterized protein n=1 Tax=Georgenia yuyongxinii TaxID=2589797 RepID=A0A5B8C7T4_9MICO|nr:hypothetical protein [Georgenia yuyongxinii]QDC25511.1 hypothetical protein FE374_13615 [Georgenia yuyongxinii]